MNTAGKQYCSLDIETSGFDPLTNEILEVGFAFFELSDRGVKITEEWTQVFKPSKPVPPAIFGLTGISQKELDEAPLFSEHRDFIQKKLKDAVIVGHNIIFDIKFLESCGIKFSGETIDTLDLVQFLLPTHHSYNLENLMHTFGISHKEAHRALADSKATLKLLEKLLQVFSGLPKELKNEIQKLVANYNFFWKDFLSLNLKPILFTELASRAAKQKATGQKFTPEPQAIYNFSLLPNNIENLAERLSKSESKVLLVVPKAQQAMEIFKHELAAEAVFLPEHQFDSKKLLALTKKESLSDQELKFLLKVLVWQEINWQTKTVLDLNLSFFGGQFKNLVTGGKVKENKTAKLVVCDQATFLYLSDNKLYKNRQVIIWGLNEFENSVSANISTKTSWGYINYLLKSFYNPELNSGQEKFKQATGDGLLASDLFFGLTSAMLQTDPPGFLYFKISNEIEYEEKYQKIKAAAESFIDKLSGVNKILQSKEIEKFTENLTQFFQKQDNRVKWIELAENRCSFLSMPIDITNLVKNTLEPFSKVSFADALDKELLPKFFINRLGLNKFKLQELNFVKEKKQGDLFSGVKTILAGKLQVINYHCLAKNTTSNFLMEIIGHDKTFPAAILFPGQMQLKEFYEQNYETLKQRAAVLSQSSSGGSNKIFRNFSINPKSLLLATDKFILRHLGNQSSVEPVEKLRVKTLVLCRLPFEQFTHPYQEAVSKSLPNAFMDYALPKALYNFQSILKFFYTPELKDIYVIDTKLTKDYASVFKEYYNFIPNSSLKT